MVAHARDVEISRKANDVDITDRSTAGWEGKRAGLRSWSGSFTLVQHTGDTVFSALQTAWKDGAYLAVVLTKGTTTETGECYVSDFSESQPNNGIVTIKVAITGNGGLTSETVTP